MPTPTSPAAWQQYRAQLAGYRNAKVNYDAEHAQELTTANGWRLDHYATDLPPEAPGPGPQGSFAAAQDVLWHYAFPPPNLIRGYFDPQQPLAQRIMLLQAQFLAFRFYFGVRIVDVRDDTVPATPASAQAGPERVWGYGYRTLEGHFEMGQINFSIHKNLLTGSVQFRIDAVSKAGRIRNPIYWLGFTLFGRMLQKRFARQSLARMRQPVADALARPAT